ncbi:uncharacterized protein LOC132272646 [Cornus florida]|uniref:uncharacterized protein LOC132272646 n=1 Tax=Cornus florida TaxID=4283 RepID=UPI0028A1F42F|nr:uncharacterized protein LOC132272646 [Cornus florida]
MEDLPINNGDWSWCNKQITHKRINAKLDRVLVNAEWLHQFNDSKVVFTPSSLLDHYGLLVQWFFDCSVGPKPFKFLKIWCLQAKVEKVVKKAWECNVTGSPIHVLQKKLRSVKDTVKSWNKERETTSDQLQAAREAIYSVQMDLLQDPNNQDSISKEREATDNLQHVLGLEEIVWA